MIPAEVTDRTHPVLVLVVSTVLHSERFANRLERFSRPGGGSAFGVGEVGHELGTRLEGENFFIRFVRRNDCERKIG